MLYDSVVCDMVDVGVVSSLWAVVFGSIGCLCVCFAVTGGVKFLSLISRASDISDCSVGFSILIE